MSSNCLLLLFISCGSSAVVASSLVAGSSTVVASSLVAGSSAVVASSLVGESIFSAASASLLTPKNKVAPTKIEAVPTVNFLIEYLFNVFGKKSKRFFEFFNKFTPLKFPIIKFCLKPILIIALNILIINGISFITKQDLIV